MKRHRKTENCDPDRLKQVIAWILAANDERDIRAAISEKWPGQNPQEAIEHAVKEIIAIGNESAEFTRGWALAATRDIVRRLLEVGDYTNALRGVKQVADLAGKEPE